ncbi:DNA cytosine methyltransferase [Aurantiacibacter spongiae]|uniref:Cytosine-specific methyltransferase n=1 Tax=Aurantiacibacter spongiae TaxID=2488860 RepID=A0A3N5D0V1_9SPHN|nr:DNA cytosine methyltransferase [Aurantiacibacter spongiae]
MRYLSVCSGIEAATVAWRPLGWKCAGVSEIEPFPRAVLEQRLGAVSVDDEHHYSPGSNVLPLFGDFTKIEAQHVGPVDLLVGGTPCQSFSIAGKRLGLDDPRGNLTLEFLALARRIQPRWIVWENVPGVLSHDEGRTMGTFLRLVGECGFRWAYRVLDAQYVRVGRFGRAVPQRRRRVFLVGYSGAADINPAAVLFDRESLRGNPAPRREAGEVAPTVPSRSTAGGGLGTDFDCDGGLIANSGDASFCVSVNGQRSNDAETETLIAHALRGEGFDASEDGTGRGTPIVPVAPTLRAGGNSTGGTRPYGTDADTCDSLVPIAIQERAVSENPAAGPDGKGWRNDGAAYTLEARQVSQAVAFSAKDHGADAMSECSPTLHAGGHTASHANAGVMPAVAFQERGRADGRHLEIQEGVAYALTAPSGGGRAQERNILHDWAVRRLTPTECARLQGFPDDWARIAWRNKTAENCPDGPQYKAYGNSMAVNVMSWIGERIAAVDAISERIAA